MIDPHVHLRDWGESHKMTLEHGLILAQMAGFSQVFEMPNTKPPIISREMAIKRISDADRAIEKNGLLIKHGLYMGLIFDDEQIKEAINSYNEFFPRIVGLKLYCASTTGELKISNDYSQYRLLQSLANLNYEGVLAVHCEHEELFHPEMWDPTRPSTHNFERPLESEYYSVKTIINLAKLVDFKGKLHICHVSNPYSIKEINNVKNYSNFKITCGITPHHAIYNTEYMDNLDQKDALLLRVNPPIRDKKTQEQLFQSILNGEIDFIESDFAPHTLEEKINSDSTNPYACGIADFGLYNQLIEKLKAERLSSNDIWKLTDYNIINNFGLQKII